MDNGATTMVDPEVVKTMLPYFTEKFGNASSVHGKGQEAKRVLEESRETVAKSIRAKPSEIIFTSGGTESDNLAIKGIVYNNKDKNHIITSSIEHHAVLNTCKELEKEGFKVTYLDVDKGGFIDLEQLEKNITNKTALVSIIQGNNEIGTIQDIEKIGKICRKNNVLFHSDTIQSFTKTSLDVRKVGVDLLSFSAHKIHGPKGVGALFLREGLKIKPLYQGGAHERGIRPGTENISSIVGFAKAVSLCKSGHVEHMKRLRDYLIDSVLKDIDNVLLNGPRKERLCNNANLCFRHVEGEGLGAYLDVNGICVSSGSACSSLELKPSHVLIAIGLNKELANGSLRFTLSRFTTKDDIDYVLENLVKHVGKLRKISPLRS